MSNAAGPSAYWVRDTLTALQPSAPLQSWPDFLQGSRLGQGAALVSS